jgi:hypothetical protein
MDEIGYNCTKIVCCLDVGTVLKSFISLKQLVYIRIVDLLNAVQFLWDML